MIKINKKIGLFLSSLLLMAVLFVFYNYRYKIYYKFLGGSPLVLMVGSTLTQNGHWESLLSRPDVINIGKLNATTSQILSSSSRVLCFKPKICFIEGGANDLIHGVGIRDIEQNISLLVTDLRARSVLPVIELNIYSSSDTLLNKRIDSLNVALVELAHQTGTEYIDLNSALSVNGFLQKKYAKESLLLSKDAYPLWAALVNQVLYKHNI